MSKETKINIPNTINIPFMTWEAGGKAAGQISVTLFPHYFENYATRKNGQPDTSPLIEDLCKDLRYAFSFILQHALNPQELERIAAARLPKETDILLLDPYYRHSADSRCDCGDSHSDNPPPVEKEKETHQ